MTVEIDWGDACHKITWRSGKLVLEQHRDSAAEDAWVALGGERCPCLDLLSSWDDWRRDPSKLLLWSERHERPLHGFLRPGVPPASTPGELLDRLRRQYKDFQHRFALRAQATAGATGAPPPGLRQRGMAQFEEQHRRVWRDALYWALPRELRDRLALSAVVGALRNRDDRHSWHQWRPAVERAISAHAVPALQESIRFWRGRAGAHPRHPTVEAWVTNPGEPVTLFGLVDKAGGWAAASLDGTWLIDVWSQHAALVDGCFVVAVTAWDEYPDRLSVLAARWERESGEGSTPVIEPAIAFRTGPDSWALRWV